eukprot:SAG22_NODE_58_length_23645_cov_16.637943_6_plen_301_part_00
MSFFLEAEDDIEDEISGENSSDEADEVDEEDDDDDDGEVGWDRFLGSEKTPIVHSPTHVRQDDRRKKEMSAAELEAWFDAQCLSRVNAGEEKQRSSALSELRYLQTKLDDELDMFSVDTHPDNPLVEKLVRCAMAEVKALLAEFEKPEMWQKGRQKFVAAVTAANKQQAAAITLATQAEAASRASKELDTMKSKLDVSRQAALQRVDSSVKELTEDYEKQERELSLRIESERREGNHVEALRLEAVNMSVENARQGKELAEEAERAEKQMMIKIRMLGASAGRGSATFKMGHQLLVCPCL